MSTAHCPTWKKYSFSSFLFAHRHTNDQKAPRGLAVGLFRIIQAIQSAMSFPHSYSRRRSTMHRRVNSQAMYTKTGCPGETDLDFFFWSKFKVTIVYYFMNILHKRGRHVGYLSS